MKAISSLTSLKLSLLLAVLLIGSRVHTLPLDEATAIDTINATDKTSAATVETSQSTDLVAPTELVTDEEQAGSRENTGAAAILPPDQSLLVDGSVGGDHRRTIPALSPAEQFQQYYSNFNPPYSPFYPYPAPPGYGSALSYPPTPYVVQTDYDGYLMATTNPDPSQTATSAALEPLSYMRHLVSGFMATTVFRVLAAIVSVVGVIFFGGAITTAICSFTPICDISFKAVTYLKRTDAAERVAKTLVEEVAGERVRRASELVWKAIRKYSEMQQEAE